MLSDVSALVLTVVVLVGKVQRRTQGTYSITHPNTSLRQVLFLSLELLSVSHSDSPLVSTPVSGVIDVETWVLGS